MLGRLAARVLAMRGAAIALTFYGAGSIGMGLVAWDVGHVAAGAAWLCIAAAAHDTRTNHLRTTPTEETSRP